MKMLGRILNSHGTQGIQNRRDRHVLIALSKSRCPVYLLQPRDVYLYSRQFATQQDLKPIRFGLHCLRWAPGSSVGIWDGENDARIKLLAQNKEE